MEPPRLPRQDSMIRHARVRENVGDLLVGSIVLLHALFTMVWQVGILIAEIVYLARYFKSDCDKAHLGAVVVCFCILHGMDVFAWCYGQNQNPSRFRSVLFVISFMLANVYYWNAHCESHFDALVLVILVYHYFFIGVAIFWFCFLRPCLIRWASQRGPAGDDIIFRQLAWTQQLQWPQRRGVGGGVTARLSSRAIERLEKHTFAELHATQPLIDGDCSVCIETFQMDTSVRQLECKHVFHTECIDKWLQVHATCPLCRNSVAPGSSSSSTSHDASSVLSSSSSSSSLSSLDSIV